MATLDSVMLAMNKKCGENTIMRGKKVLRNPPRIPTGVFAVDFITGGGLPLHGTTCFWGGTSSGKTTLALDAVAASQRICWRCFNTLSHCTCSESPLLLSTYFADVEGTIEDDWAMAAGIDPERYVIGMADYGEQHINIVDQVLQADDCGLVVLDSLAALVPAAEMESQMEDKFIASQARLITSSVRKLKQRVIRERKRGHPCLVLFTNQMRTKVGQRFGNPETMSGGHGMFHEFSLLLRCGKKVLTESDSKWKPDNANGHPYGQRHTCAIKKFKVGVLGGACEFVRAIKDNQAAGCSKGEIADGSLLLKYAKEHGMLTKEGDSYRFLGIKAKRQADYRELWHKNPEEKLRAQMEVIKTAMRCV